MSPVRRMADQVGIIREGRLVDLWQVSVLKSHALRRFELDFARPVPAAVFERLSGVADEGAVLGVAEPADRLAVRGVGGVAPGQRDAPGGQEAGDTVVAGPAVDMAQVVTLGEGPERLVTL